MVTDKAFQEEGIDGHIGMPQSCGTFPMVQSLTSRVRFVEAANSFLSNASNTCFFCSEESTRVEQPAIEPNRSKASAQQLATPHDGATIAEDDLRRQATKRESS